MRCFAGWVLCAGIAWAETPVSSWAEQPRFGLTAGAFIGGGIGNEGVDFGGRLGVRFRAAEWLAFSLLTDLTFAPFLVASQCDPQTPTGCPIGDRLFLITPTAVARVEIVSGGTIGAMFVPKWSAALFFGVGSAILSDNPTATSDPGAYGTFENPFVRFGLHLAMTRFPVYEFPLPLFVEVGGWALLGGRVQPFFTVGVGL